MSEDEKTEVPTPSDEERCPHCAKISEIQKKGQRLFNASRGLKALGYAALGFAIGGSVGMNPVVAVVGACAYCATRVIIDLIDRKLSTLNQQLEEANNEHGAVNVGRVQDLLDRVMRTGRPHSAKAGEPPLPS